MIKLTNMGLDAWGPMLGLLFEDGSSDYILGALQRAGIPTAFNLSEAEAYSHNTRKRAYLRQLAPLYAQLSEAEKHCVARNLAQEISKSDAGRDRLGSVLERVGWTFREGELMLASDGTRENAPDGNAVSSNTQAISKVAPNSTASELLLAEIEDIITGMPPRETIRHDTPQNHNWFGRVSAAIEKWNPAKAPLVKEYLDLFFSNGHARDTVHGLNKLLVLMDQAKAELKLSIGMRAHPVSVAKAATVVKALPRKIFIVHGHDAGAREGVARFVEKIGFEAIILQEQANQGRTVIEKVEAHGDVGFAVVLLTPDDEGRVNGGTLRPRPRQNVLLELGYFIGRLGRAHVCSLATSSVMELPTDFAGVVWESFDASGGWKTALVRELHAAGFRIDVNHVI